MGDSPFFSVIIPCYNRAHVLAKTVDTVLNQEETSFELIIIDDGSTDNTRELVASYTDKRIRYYYQDNAERGAARNHGIQKSQGKYVTFLDSDDIFYKDHLKVAKAYLESKSESVQFYFQPYEIVDTSGKHVQSPPAFGSDLNLMLVKYGNFMSCLGVFLMRSLALEQPFRDDRVLAGSEDYELWLRLAARVDIERGSKVTAALVQHPDRSVFNFEATPLIERQNRFLHFLEEDRPFMNRFGSYFNIIRSGAYSYVALHLPFTSDGRKLRIQYTLKSIKYASTSIFSKRFLVIIRQILFGR